MNFKEQDFWEQVVDPRPWRVGKTIYVPWVEPLHYEGRLVKAASVGDTELVVDSTRGLEANQVILIGPWIRFYAETVLTDEERATLPENEMTVVESLQETLIVLREGVSRAHGIGETIQVLGRLRVNTEVEDAKSRVGR